MSRLRSDRLDLREDICDEAEHDGQVVCADGLRDVNYICLEKLLTAWSVIGRQDNRTSVLPAVAERQQDKRREEEEPQVQGRQSS